MGACGKCRCPSSETLRGYGSCRVSYKAFRGIWEAENPIFGEELACEQKSMPSLSAAMSEIHPWPQPSCDVAHMTKLMFRDFLYIVASQDRVVCFQENTFFSLFQISARFHWVQHYRCNRNPGVRRGGRAALYEGATEEI